MSDSVLTKDLDAQRALLGEAYVAAQQSPDESTQNGALLFAVDEYASWISVREGTQAFNHFPRGVAYSDERWERPTKYEFIEHAERGAIYAAARYGIRTEELWMACPWAACADCARAIIESGLTGLLTHKQAYDKSPDRWKDSIANAFTMLEEANIEIVWYDGQVFTDDTKLLHTGELWTP